MRARLLADPTEITKGRRFSTVSDICSRASKSPFWSRVLFEMIREFKPYNAVELGTSLGISAAYQGAAQKLNGRGKLLTIEGNPVISALARKNLIDIELDNITVETGLFQDVLIGLLERLNPVDYVFIDGHHDEQATVAYFTKLLPYLAPTALMIFDDIEWSAGMRRAWRLISVDPIVSTSLDLHQIGICVVVRDAASASVGHLHVANVA